MESTTRRRFLQGAAAASAAPLLPDWFLRAEAEALLEAEQARPRRIGPNDTIQIGVIGPGGSRGGFRQGLGVTRWASSKPGVKVVAVCDVDKVHRDEAAAAFPSGPRKFSDYRELIAKGLCDAVIIGTPDHWHHLNCLDSLKAGLDVYCEKPLTLTIQEGRDIAESVKRHKRIFQTGSQQRSDGRFRLAVQLVRAGRIGKLQSVKTCLPGGPRGGPFEPMPVPQELDWNMWLGPAPWADYTFKRTHGEFRWWLDYSGGMLTDWGAHHHDIAQWGMGTDDTGPVWVEATGTPQPSISRWSYSTFPEYRVLFTYASGVEMVSTNVGENGVTFEGEEGWIFVTRGDIKASDPRLISDPLPPGAPAVYVSNDHVQNFFDGMRTRKECICTAEIGHRSATICHLANISLSLGGARLNWDPKREVFLNSPAANLHRSRPSRAWDKAVTNK
jgi:predicted dehydrogenase